MSKEIAIVTGGVGGIGTSICHKLANTGFKVIATYYKDDIQKWLKHHEKYNYDIKIASLDVTSFTACEKFANKILDNENISVLVNVAGIIKDNLLRNMTEKEWHAVINTNLNGVFNITRQFINQMIKKKYGRIINISSVNAQKGQAGQTNYAAAKAGMHGFTKSLALEVAKYGITVNTISPGYVDTPMMQQIAPEILAKIIASVPVKRLATVNEIANMVNFLATKENSFITGANFSINGGLHMQ